MSSETADRNVGRRGFLQGVALVTGTLSISPPAVAKDNDSNSTSPSPAEPVAAQRLPTPEAGYLSLGPDEAGFVEALVNIMCPADNLTPNGVDCGLAAYIDRQLAGGFGKGERLYMCGPWKAGKPQHGYQLPLTPEQFFKAGIAATDDAAKQRSKRIFVELQDAEANALLNDIAAGKVHDERLSLSAWFNQLVYPLFLQACFADPVYGGNVGKVFWRLIGYPGLPAVHGDDMVNFRGKPYPDARNPKSIADFS